MFSSSFWFCVFASFITGVFASIQTGIGYLYMIEQFTKKNRVFYCGLYMVLDSAVNLITAFYYLYVSNNWIYLTAIGYGLQIFSCIICWFLPESPIWFLNKNRAHKATPSLEKIARINGRTLEFDPKNFKKPKSVGMNISSPTTVKSGITTITAATSAS